MIFNHPSFFAGPYSSFAQNSYLRLKKTGKKQSNTCQLNEPNQTRVMIRTSACNIFRLIESDRDTAGNALQWNVVGWWNPATSSADQNLARKGGSSVFLFGNMIGREEVQLSSQATLHCRVTKACNILWSKSGKEEILSLGSPATLFCTGTPLVISGNLPEIRALLLHKIGWKLVMSMIRVMRVKTDMLITMKSRTGRVLWPPKLYFFGTLSFFLAIFNTW